MMKTNVVLFGASRLGQAAYLMLKDQENIHSFCDNDLNKWGKKVEGTDLTIISPIQLKEIENLKIIITSSYAEEISNQLRAMNLTNFEVFTVQISYNSKDDVKMDEINLGRFLYDLNEEIVFGDLTYMTGGSSLLDYAFLKAIMVKFGLQTYLEIGTFMGESIAAISDVAKMCYSISLPDQDLAHFFKKMNKRNFSRYFSGEKDNIVHFQQDSKLFRFDQLAEHMDLVFIDGDHSYEGIFIDTKNIFNFIDPNHTIVVWHDFKDHKKKFRMTTVNAVLDGVPKKYHQRVFAVDNNMCGIYLPEKYGSAFSFEIQSDELFSYETKVLPKRNVLE